MTSTLRPLAPVPLVLLTTGCMFFGKPNAANVQLRKDKQQLQARVEQLEQQHQSDQAELRALWQQRAASSPGAATTRPAVPPEVLAQLFTAHGLKFGRLTGGFDKDRKQPGDEGIKVYVVPTDQDGQPLKAAGSFKVEAFDLADEQSPLIGTWTFDVEQARKNWYGAFMDYTYAFTLPWQKAPKHNDLTVKVTFTDALTGLSFENQSRAKVNLPTPTTAPSP